MCTDCNFHILSNVLLFFTYIEKLLPRVELIPQHNFAYVIYVCHYVEYINELLQLPLCTGISSSVQWHVLCRH